MATTGYYIVLDFDGTVVKHHYPAVGDDIGAAPVLKRLVANGHKLLLSTMRSKSSEGADTLQPALDWFENNGIPLYGVNENPDQKSWTDSPKIYGHLTIDDTALGAPLKADPAGGAPFIDWSVAAVYLCLHGILTETDLLELVQQGSIDISNLNVK